MSNRTKRVTTTSYVTKISTPSSASKMTSSQSSSMSARPASPTMISRMQEKTELAGLNDRLAQYIEKVRSLELENGRLTKMFQSQEESVSKETSKVKGMYEGELAGARRLLDETSKEKARYQMENTNLRKELDDLKEKFKSKEKDISMLEKRLMSAESQVSDLQARLNDAVNQRRHWEDEYNKLKKELDANLKAMASLKKDVDDETLHRVDLENKLQSMREELEFKTNIHRQELSESMMRSTIQFEEIDTRLQVEYDSKLTEALQLMRAENEEQLRMMRMESESVFEKKYNDLREQASRNDGVTEKTMSEMRSLRKRIDELNGDVSRLQAQNGQSDARIRELEGELRNEKDGHLAIVESLEAQIRSLRVTIDDQMMEYRDLMDIKIQLDMEIAAYRKLLETEENRLKVSSPGRVTINSSMMESGGDSSRKRRRMDMESTSYSMGDRSMVNGGGGSMEFSFSKSAKDTVELTEMATDGKYVKLTNTSPDQEVAIGQWQLKQESGDKEVLFKFHRTLHIKPGFTVTVWSNDADATHSPPGDIIMKNQSWLTGDEIKTSLLNSNGEEMATIEMRKSTTRSGIVYSRSEHISSSGPSKGRSWLSFLSFLA